MKEDTIFDAVAVMATAALVVFILFLVSVLFAAEPPKDDLASCKADLAVTAQYAAQQQRTRNQAEQDLARALARVAQVKAALLAVLHAGPTH